MKDETENFPYDEHDAKEERLLALLLGELDPKEAELLEAHISEDSHLQSLRERLEKSLDLVEEAARGKSVLDSESLRLDPSRRRELEKLWIEKKPEPDLERESEPVPFEVVAEDQVRDKSWFMRFIPMAAAAALAVGATGIIVRSLMQESEHQEDMVLASENASLSREERTVVGIVRESPSGRQTESGKSGSTSRQRMESLPEASNFTVDFEATPTSEPKTQALEKVRDVLDLKIQNDSREILSKRIAEDIEEINDELRTNGADLARRLNGIRKESDQDDATISSDGNLDTALEFSSRKGLPAGLVGSVVEAEELDKRTSSVSGGASAVGAGLSLPPKPGAASPSPARVAVRENESRKDVVVPARTQGDAGALALIADDDRVSAALSNDQDLDKRANLPKDQPAPTSEITPDDHNEKVKARRARASGKPFLDENSNAVSKEDRGSLPVVVAELASRIASPAPFAAEAKMSEDFSSIVRQNKKPSKLAFSSSPGSAVNKGVDLDVSSSAIVHDKSKSKENQSHSSPSIHQPAASAGAVIGEKGAKKELLAFAEFGLDTPASESKQKKSPIRKEIAGKSEEKLSGSEDPQEQAYFKAEADKSIVKAESSNDGRSEIPTEQIAVVERGDATVDSVGDTGLALTFALLAFVCLSLVLLLYFRKRNS